MPIRFFGDRRARAFRYDSRGHEPRATQPQILFSIWPRATKRHYKSMIYHAIYHFISFDKANGIAEIPPKYFICIFTNADALKELDTCIKSALYKFVLNVLF